MDSTSQRDIERLIVRARAGDNSALGGVLESFRDYLKLLARLGLDRQLQGKVSPSDVVQETFLSAKKAFRNFRGHHERELMVWLRTILAAEITNQFRYYSRNRRAIGMEQRLGEDLHRTSAGLLSGVVDPGHSPSEIATRRETEVVVAAALSQLKEEHREVIILRNFERLSFPEIAQSMGRTTAAVKSLWVRALANLRQTLANNESDCQQRENPW